MCLCLFCLLFVSFLDVKVHGLQWINNRKKPLDMGYPSSHKINTKYIINIKNEKNKWEFSEYKTAVNFVNTSRHSAGVVECVGMSKMC